MGRAFFSMRNYRHIKNNRRFIDALSLFAIFTIKLRQLILKKTANMLRLAFLLLLFPLVMSAQDYPETLVLRNGDSLRCFIDSLNDETVYYSFFNERDQKVASFLSKTAVAGIVTNDRLIKFDQGSQGNPLPASVQRSPLAVEQEKYAELEERMERAGLYLDKSANFSRASLVAAIIGGVLASIVIDSDPNTAVAIAASGSISSLVLFIASINNQSKASRALRGWY
jgi:uncharacterized membrane protein YbjE (DUF340 family)